MKIKGKTIFVIGSDKPADGKLDDAISVPTKYRKPKYDINRKDLKALIKSLDIIKSQGNNWKEGTFGWHPSDANYRQFLHEMAAFIWNNAIDHHNFNDLRSFYLALPNAKAKESYLQVMTSNFPVKFIAKSEIFKKDKNTWDDFSKKTISTINFLPNIKSTGKGVTAFNHELSPAEFYDIFLDGIIEGRKHFSIDDIDYAIEILEQIRAQKKKRKKRN